MSTDPQYAMPQLLAAITRGDPILGEPGHGARAERSASHGWLRRSVLGTWRRWADRGRPQPVHAPGAEARPALRGCR